MSRHHKSRKSGLAKRVRSAHVDRFIPGSEQTEVPVGFEMLLYRAAEDPDFAEALVADRERAAAAWGVPLRPSERATLSAVSDDMLRAMIQRLRPGHAQRRGFMGNVAAAVASLAAGTAAVGALSSCDDDTSSGATTSSTTTAGGTQTGATTSTGSTTTSTTTTWTPTGGVGGIEPGGYGGVGGGGGAAGGAGGGGSSAGGAGG